MIKCTHEWKQLKHTKYYNCIKCEAQGVGTYMTPPKRATSSKAKSHLQKEAQRRNWRIFQLRGLARIAGKSLDKQFLKPVLAAIDKQLTSIGAETEEERMKR